MNERDGYPNGVTCWVDVDLPDPEAATEFYGGLFGWEFEDRMPAEAPGHYFAALVRGLDVAAIGSRPDGATWPPAWNTYIWVESADDTAAKIKEAGGSLLMEPYDVNGAGRMALAADPQGAAFRLQQARNHRGARIVNEPNTWNFSGLSTTDPEAAIAFYNAVFGWEADFDADGYSFFRVPGYGDYLEREIDPNLRRDLGDQSAPPGFEDATAWLISIDGQPEGTPPNWSVTFSVDDADAVAARAAKLGGTLLVEPFDSPPVRTAVIADPQGASFAVSKYTPPNA